jgi:hypothetical protein
MLHQPPEAFAAPHPASLWTAEVKVRFLDGLAQRGNVRAACRTVGLSAETAYRQRRRDPVFARAWAAAMALARKAAEQVLADRAIDGVEEEVWFHGEIHGTRTRYDGRLLLAHLARLDKAADEAAERDAERFDELLAVIAGENPPETDEPDEPEGNDLLPDRDTFIRRAMIEAIRAVFDRRQPECNALGEIVDDEEADACQHECDEAEHRAHDAAHDRWDEWLAQAHGAVDALIAPGFPDGARPALSSLPRTLSTVSTPALAQALATNAGNLLPQRGGAGGRDAR